LVVENSNAIVSHSGHLINLDERLVATTDAVYANSWAIATLNDATIGLAITNSNAIDAHYNLIVQNSNAIYANSWAISAFIANDPVALATDNSWAILSLTEDVTDNTDWLNLIHGPVSDIHFSSNTTLTCDIWLSPDHRLVLHGNMILDGATHGIHCSRAQTPLILLDQDVSVTFQDVLVDGIRPEQLALDSGAHFVFGDQTTVKLLENNDLTETWTFGGTSTLLGDGTVLNLAAGVGAEGMIYVVNDSILSVQDLTVSGVQDNRVFCQSDYSSFEFLNVGLVMSGNYSFTTGSFSIDHSLFVDGPYEFAYQSAYGSTIDQMSELVIERDVIFKYNPPVACRDLIIMTDATSIIHLDGCTLDVSSTGLQLTKGTLRISNQNYVQSDATHREEALIFGDGNSVNDLEIEIEAGGSLKMLSGIERYWNASG
ncbi:hypothetical protein KAU11_04430, partial [Candidatus Babeliales bacterium]|nr:hypothetical protein [Candidatus Babeliales bacterium]